MAKFTPKNLNDHANVNVSKISQPKEFVVLLSGLIGIMLVVYLVLGFTLEILVKHMPTKMDDALANVFPMDQFETPKNLKSARDSLQTLLDELVTLWPEANEQAYNINIVDEDQVNAFALPGRNIVVLRGLLDEVESENELAMVLAHELGHFANRDHLRGMGRGVVFLVLSVIFFGDNNPATEFASGAINMVSLKFSREQESASDRFALDLLHKKYGHVAGSTDFFNRVKDKHNIPGFFNFVSTHPIGNKRVEEIERLARESNYLYQEKQSLNDTIVAALKSDDDLEDAIEVEEIFVEIYQ